MIEVGAPVPSMKLVDTDLKPTRLFNKKEKTATVIAFFPGAFTGVCTKEMCTFRDNLARLSELNAKVVAVSIDSPFSNKGFKDANRLNFSILSDYKKRAVRKFGIELKDFASLKGYNVAKRSVFVVNKEGNVSYKWVSDDPAVEPDYEILIREVEKVR